MTIRGAVDRVDTDGAVGWIYWPDAKGKTSVEAILMGRIIGEAVADLERPDLAEVGFGDGRCGFQVQFYDRIDSSLLPLVSVRPQSSDLELPRTNLTGLSDFLSGVRRDFPMAGRSRSVFGGLWIDRTDADRVLTSRMNVGAISASLQDPLRRIVNEGAATFRGVLSKSQVGRDKRELVELLPNGIVDPNAFDGAADFLNRLPATIFQPAIVQFLQSALDDNPLICQTRLSEGRSARFTQPSAMEGLPSPTESLALVTALDADPCEVETVTDSHLLPEFLDDGASRYLVADPSDFIERAISNGASVRTEEIGSSDLAVIAPGTLFRVRAPSGARAVVMLVVPARQTPAYHLRRETGQFRVSHFSGAALIA